MSNHLHNELRKEFQLERLILFSDAVFIPLIIPFILKGVYRLMKDQLSPTAKNDPT